MTMMNMMKRNGTSDQLTAGRVERETIHAPVGSHSIRLAIGYMAMRGWTMFDQDVEPGPDGRIGLYFCRQR